MLRVIAIAAACVLVYFIDPEKNNIYSCISYSVFGFYCPACGMTRSAHCLMHFEFAQAFAYNQFFVITVLFFAYIIIADSVNTYSGRKIIPLFKFNKYAAFAIIGIFILYGVLRNFEALNFLAPGKVA